MTSFGPWQRLRPAGYTLASTLVSFGGILNGLDTGSIGGITAMEQFSDTFGVITPTARGFTVSLIMLAGVLPSLFAGQLADRFGGLRIIALGAIMFVVGCILQGAASHLSMFLVGRSVAGFGQGMWLGNVSVYICEIAPSAKRGMLVSTPQLLTALGICVGYFTCFGTVRLTTSMAWRTPFIIQGIIAALLGLSCRFIPNSPRWLVLHDRRAEAVREIEKLGIHREEAEKDILRIPEGDQGRGSNGFLESLLMPFARAYRRRTILALFVLGMVQLSGIDGVLYYAPTLFEQAGLPEQTAGFLASGLSSILVLAISVPAMMFADRWGRRVSVITGGILLSGCMLLIGSLYAANQIHEYGTARWIVIVSIFVFALTYASTWGIVGRIVASEIQPARTRAGANCVAQALSFLMNWLVAFATPVFLAASSSGPYFLFGFLALGTVATLAVIQPETRGQPLESIQTSFQRPVGKSLWYHIRRVFSSADAANASAGVSSLAVSSTVGSSATPNASSIELDSLGSPQRRGQGEDSRQ